jgi:hypothetical protein
LVDAFLLSTQTEETTQAQLFRQEKLHFTAPDGATPLGEMHSCAYGFINAWTI